MLDAYIIERIRREREIQQEQGTFVPLHIDVPQPRPRQDKPERREDESGSTVVDYQL